MNLRGRGWGRNRPSPPALSRAAGVRVLMRAAVLLGVCAVGVLTAAAAEAGTSGDPVTLKLASTVSPGSLVISVPDTEATLPSPTLNGTGTLLTSTGQLQPITVTDNRSNDPGWTLSGEISGPAQGATGFDGEYLGWTPSLVGESPGQKIVLGLTVKPGPDPGSGSGLFGLDQPQILAFTTGGVGLGSAHISATLTLDLPTTVRAGTYSVTLTLTAI